MADRLIQDLQLVYTVVRAVSDLYNGLDDDNQESGIKKTFKQNVCYYIHAELSFTLFIIIMMYPTDENPYMVAGGCCLLSIMCLSS